MRFKSAAVDGFQIFAVTGTNTISFAIQASNAARNALLGFAVERSKGNGPRRRMPGFKVFRSIIPKPGKTTQVSTWDHPVQSLVWDDFTADPDTTYEFFFHPLRGTPANLDRSASPVGIKIHTEPINARNNVYKAWGAFLRDPVYQWVRETNARELQFNNHVSYIHSKFLLMDPLGADPIVVTGSANFSKASKLNRARPRRALSSHRTAIICSSTRAPWFNEATPTVARAGGSFGKNSR